MMAMFRPIYLHVLFRGGGTFAYLVTSTLSRGSRSIMDTFAENYRLFDPRRVMRSQLGGEGASSSILPLKPLR